MKTKAALGAALDKNMLLPPNLQEVDNLYSSLVHYAEKTPSALALKDDDLVLNYRELKELVDGCAKALLDNGISRGSRVATWSDPSAKFFVTFLAATSIGCLWLGLNPKYRAQELRYLLGDFQPDLVTAMPSILGAHALSELESVHRSEFSDTSELQIWWGKDDFPLVNSGITEEELQAARDSVRKTDPCAIIYTSGTTGAPKGAILTHESVHSSAVINAQWNYALRAKTLCFFPINHVASLNNLCMNNLVCGGTIVFQPEFNPESVLNAIEKEQISAISFLPTMWMMIEASPSFEDTDLSSLELLYWGGAPMPEHLARRCQEMGISCAVIYGQSETSGIVTFARTGHDVTFEDITASVGKPLDGINWRLTDPVTGKVVLPGETGELQLKSTISAAGYLNKPDATEELFTTDGYLKTGDLMTERDDGLLRLVGRTKEMFKSGGENVYPLEIEGCINSHPEVQMSAVVPVSDDLYYEVGYGVVLREQSSSLDQEGLKMFLKQRLANYKVPKYLEFVEELPLLPNGKINKLALQDRAAKNASARQVGI